MPDAYPDRLFRFIRKSADVSPNKKINAKVFEPDKNTRERADNCLELSVDWEDNAEVLPRVKNRPQAKQVAAIHRDIIDTLQGRPGGLPEGVLSYERAPLEENEHHGNLLFLKSAPLHERRRASWVLASLAELV